MHGGLMGGWGLEGKICPVPGKKGEIRTGTIDTTSTYLPL